MFQTEIVSGAFAINSSGMTVPTFVPPGHIAAAASIERFFFGMERVYPEALILDRGRCDSAGR